MQQQILDAESRREKKGVPSLSLGSVALGSRVVGRVGGVGMRHQGHKAPTPRPTYSGICKRKKS
jgi:hypothetical protein